MTTSTTTPVAGATGTAGQVARQRWNRLRWPLAVAALVLLTTLIGVLTLPRSAGGDLDPDSAAPQGSRAVVQILTRQGVQVDRATTSRQAQEAAGADRRGTLVVVHPELLGPEQLRRLAAVPADLVLVAPDGPVLDALAPGIDPAGPGIRDARAPDCDDPAARAAGAARAAARLYRGAAGDRSCYPFEDAAGLVIRERDGRRIAVLGGADVLRNSALADEGNAALALRLLGTNPTLTWYLPSVEELAVEGGAPELGELVPRWVPWVAVQLLLATLVALVWRSRRLGRLVAEPLPVVVRSAETQEGRARLYRRIGARARAAATLRTATLRRLAVRLDAGTETPVVHLAALAADATGREQGAVQALLLGPAPRDDAALVRLADDLDILERDLTRQATTSHAHAPGSPGSPPRTDGHP